MAKDTHTTDMFRVFMLVTEAKRQVVPGALQASIPRITLAPVDILMSASAFAQAKVPTSHRKAVMAVTAKSYGREVSIVRLKKICMNVHKRVRQRQNQLYHQNNCISANDHKQI